MIRRPPRVPRTVTLCPYTTVFRAVCSLFIEVGGDVARFRLRHRHGRHAGAGHQRRRVADVGGEHVGTVRQLAGDQRPFGQTVEVWPDLALRPADAGNSVARSEEHTSELQSLMRISYAVFCWRT